MLRLLTPIILIGLSIAGFVTLVGPTYKEVSDLKAEVASYDEALSNSKSLENERDKLTSKYSSIDPANLDKIQKLLPDNVDNIRLILEIEKLASPYGMVLKDVSYSIAKDDNKAPNVIQGGQTLKPANQDYGVWDLQFSIEGTYNDFISFSRDLESNLRIVDISSVQFSSVEKTNQFVNKNTPTESYKYSFRIRTYWLKN